METTTRTKQTAGCAVKQTSSYGAGWQQRIYLYLAEADADLSRMTNATECKYYTLYVSATKQTRELIQKANELAAAVNSGKISWQEAKAQF